MKKYYSVKEASKLLKLSTNTIYKYVDEGKLATRRIGKGRIKILYQSLLPFIDQVDTIVGKTPNTHSFSKKPSVTDEATQNVNQVEKEGWLKISQSDIGVGDRVFYRLFKSVFLLGLGVLYLFSKPTNNIYQSAALDITSNTIISTLPFILVLTGVLSLVGVIKKSTLEKMDLPVHLLQVVVLMLLIYVSMISGNYVMLVFAMPFVFIVIMHTINLLGSSKDQELSFGTLLVRHVFIFMLGIGILLLLGKNLSNYDISFLGLLPNIKYFLIVLYVLLLYVLIYIQTPRGRGSGNLNYAYLLLSLVIGSYAFLNTGAQFYDVLFSSYILSIFVFLLFVWHTLGIQIKWSRIKVIVVSVLWITATLIFGEFVIKDSIDSQNELQIGNARNSLNTAIENLTKDQNRQASTAVRFASQDELKTIIAENETEKATEKARMIYEELGSVARIIIYDAEGKALGVYPRNSIVQGTDFSGRDYFQNTIRSYNSYVSSVFNSVVGTVGMIRTEPVFNDANEISGVIGIATNLETVSQNFMSNSVDGVKIIAVDQNGNFALHWNPEMLGHSSETNTEEVIEENTSDPIIINEKIESLGWDIQMVVPVNTHLSASNGLGRIVALLIFINSAFTIFIGLLVSTGQGIKIPIKRELPFPLKEGINSAS